MHIQSLPTSRYRRRDQEITSHDLNILPLLIWSVADLADEVEIEAASGALTIGPSTHPRAGWAEAAAFDPDGLLDQMTSTRFDHEEWSW